MIILSSSPPSSFSIACYYICVCAQIFLHALSGIFFSFEWKWEWKGRRKRHKSTFAAKFHLSWCINNLTDNRRKVFFYLLRNLLFSVSLIYFFNIFLFQFDFHLKNFQFFHHTMKFSLLFFFVVDFFIRFYFSSYLSCLTMTTTMRIFEIKSIDMKQHKCNIGRNFMVENWNFH